MEKKVLHNNEAIDYYYNKYYLKEHEKYLTRDRTNKEINQLISWLSRKPGFVCDVGCGDGRHLLAFAKKGIPGGFGFDRSSELIKLAKQNLQKYPHFAVEKNGFRGWQPKKEISDLTYSLFSSFGYCLKNSGAQDLFNKMVKATKFGGLVCLDLDSVFRLKRYLRGEIKKVMTIDEDIFFDNKKKILFAKEKKNEVVLKSAMRYYTQKEMVMMFKKAGLKNIICKGGFADEKFSPASNRLIILGKK